MTDTAARGPRGGSRLHLSEGGGEGFSRNLGEVKGFRECDRAVQFPCFIAVHSEPFEADTQNLRQGEKFEPLKQIY